MLVSPRIYQAGNRGEKDEAADDEWDDCMQEWDEGGGYASKEDQREQVAETRGYGWRYVVWIAIIFSAEDDDGRHQGTEYNS